MIASGVTMFIEVGPGNVLQGLIKKVKRDIPAISAEFKKG
jgi:[acyl-carrier-protein] S-malonyltransferase